MIYILSFVLYYCILLIIFIYYKIIIKINYKNTIYEYNKTIICNLSYFIVNLYIVFSNPLFEIKS